MALIDTHGGGKHGLLNDIYLFTLLARGCSFRLLMAAVGTNRVHTHLDPYCVAGCQVTHTHTHKHLYTKGTTLCTAACKLCLKLTVFLDSLSYSRKLRHVTCLILRCDAAVYLTLNQLSDFVSCSCFSPNLDWLCCGA